MLRFARAWREVKASPLKVTDLDYLLRHQDSTGKLEPSDDELLRGVKALRDGMTAVVAAFKASVQTLRDKGAADLQALATDYPELAAVFTAADAVTDPAAKSAAVLDAILPELRDGLKTLALRTSLTAITKADATIVDAITSGSDVLHADGDPARGVLDDFRGLESSIALNAN